MEIPPEIDIGKHGTRGERTKGMRKANVSQFWARILGPLGIIMLLIAFFGDLDSDLVAFVGVASLPVLFFWLVLFIRYRYLRKKYSDG